MCIELARSQIIYSSQFKILIPFTIEKTQGIQIFAIAGQNTYIQSKNETFMKIILADENGEGIPIVEGLLEGIEDFELKIGLLLAACMISMKDGSSLIKNLKSNGRTSDCV